MAVSSIKNMFLADAGTAGSGTTLWEPLTHVAGMDREEPEEG